MGGGADASREDFQATFASYFFRLAISVKRGRPLAAEPRLWLPDGESFLPLRTVLGLYIIAYK